MYVYFVIVMTFVVIVSVIRYAVTRSKCWESFHPTLMWHWFLCWLMMLDDVNRKEEWNLNSEQDCRSVSNISHLSKRKIISKRSWEGAILVAARVVDEWASDSGDVLLECFPDAGGGSWNGLFVVLCTIPLNSNPTPICWCQVEFGKSVCTDTTTIAIVCQEHEKERWNGGLWLLAML